ncbi:MAG: efflux transporter periplasmic adaptor subunit [Hydrogenophilales bacterium 28-61-23]|nr:MAG: efflux transporter periplasmic adaptor subunit [Hydrogenophilales bacterium 28-61-23]
MNLPVFRRWSIRLLILAALLAGAYAGWRHYTKPKPLEVNVVEVALGRVEATVANTRAGTVKPCRRAKLAPQGGGQIARLLVKEGDRVAAGQVLLELWNVDLAAQIRLADEQVGSAKARRNEACAAAQAARREAARQQQLVAQGFVSAAAVDKTASEAEVREAACRAATTEIAAAEARVDTARAALSRTVLKAPFAGIVAEVTGEQGEYTTPSPPGIPTPPAIDLIDDACLYVTAPIDEVDAPRIQVGLPARIALDAFPGQHFAGRVRRIAPYVLEVEKQARTVEVEVVFTDAKAAKTLLVGYSADAEVILENRDKVLRVPAQALLDGNKVLVLKNGVLEERKVELGLSNWEFSEVRSGLQAGEKVVTSLELEGVKAGAPAVAKPKP